MAECGDRWHHSCRKNKHKPTTSKQPNGCERYRGKGQIEGNCDDEPAEHGGGDTEDRRGDGVDDCLPNRGEHNNGLRRTRGLNQRELTFTSMT